MHDYNHLNYNKVEICFIYSFLLDFEDFENFAANNNIPELKIGKPEDIPGGLPPTLNIQRKIKIGNEIYFGSELSSDWLEKKEINNEKITTLDKIHARMRVFDNGAGIYTYRITLNNPSFNDIHTALRLIRMEQKSNSQVKIFSGKYTLFQDFERILNRLNKRLGNRIKILDYDLNIIKHEEREGDVKEDFQNPYILTCCQIDKKDFKSICSLKDNRRNRKEKSQIIQELSSILLRMINGENEWEHLNIEYIKRFCEFDSDNGLLANYAMDDRIFFNFHKRSTIFLSDSALKKYPNYFVKPSLLSVLEIVRTRWHTCVVINALLDSTIQKIKREANTSNLNFVLETIRLRRLFAKYLENPIYYLFEGGAVTEISEIAQKKLWINDMTEMTYKKFEIIDKIFNDSSTILALKEIDPKYREKIESVEKKIY